MIALWRDAAAVVGGGMWAGWRGPPDPVGLSKACGQVPQQLSTGWHVPAPAPAKWIATPMVSSSPTVSSCVSSSASRGGDLRQEVNQCDGLVAVWTGSSGTYPSAKSPTIVASLFAQKTRLALRALVDNAGARYAAWQWRQGGRRVPLAPGSLTTRVVAKAPPT